LSAERQLRFRQAVKAMVSDLRGGRPFRKSLRVRPLGGHPGIYEMTWEMPSGRATFEYGSAIIPGERHIIWRRIGGHEIFVNP
jgi:hypothetical protein